MASVTPGQGGKAVFDFRVDPPIKELEFRVSRFADGIKDFTTLFTALAELFKREMVETFETEGERGGGRWTPLTDSYATWKQAHYPGRKIGVLTGALRSSMTGGGGWSQTIGKSSANFGMSPSSPAAKYGPFFDERRKVIRITPAMGRDWQKVTHTWLVGRIRTLSEGGSVAGAVRAGGGGVGSSTGLVSALAGRL